jgi:hypothetical protein
MAARDVDAVGSVTFLRVFQFIFQPFGFAPGGFGLSPGGLRLPFRRFEAFPDFGRFALFLQALFAVAAKQLRFRIVGDLLHQHNGFGPARWAGIAVMPDAVLIRPVVELPRKRGSPPEQEDQKDL